MQAEGPDKIRNVALAGHNDTGKTTLASALMYAGGAATRLNRVEDGNTATDFDAEEIRRTISIGVAPCFVGWKEHKINLIDCPGYGIFFTETRAGARAADSMLLCVNAVSGIEVTTEQAWELALEEEMPVLLHLTKMDRERADLERVMESFRERFDRSVVALQLPIGREDAFEGVVDLVTETAYRFEHDGRGEAVKTEIPDTLTEAVESWRTELVEAVAESDDALMEKFFEDGTLGSDDLVAGMKRAVRRRKLFPVTMSSALHSIGTSTLLDRLVEIAPSPADRQSFPATNVGDEPVEIDCGNPEAPASVLVWKTISDPFAGKISLLRVVSGELSSDSTLWNTRGESEERVGHLLAMQGKQGTEVTKLAAGDIGGVAKLKSARTGDTLCDKQKPVKLGWIEVPTPAIAFAIEPKSKGDEEKIGEALTRLLDEDPALAANRDPDSGEFLISGAGTLHVEIAVAKLKQRYDVEVILHPPKVPYRETIRKPAPGHGRHKKQTGGRGQFADCRITLEPLERGEDFEFLDEIFGGSIPQGYRPAVEKGIQEARKRGFLAGYPVVDIRVRLKDGQHHDVDSSEMAFKVAGSLAFKDAMAQARPTILEPMMQVEITANEEFTGDIMSDLSQRRGRPQGMESTGNGSQSISALVPMAEMLDYAPSLNAMTQGRGHFTMKLERYDDVPQHVQEKLIEAARKGDEADG